MILAVIEAPAAGWLLGGSWDVRWTEWVVK